MADRPWLPPARHWDDHAHVVAGRDELAGGTWLGMNDDGVVAGLLNRINTLGPMEGFRSRGELPLEALEHAEASEAADALTHLETASYRSFNMIIADRAKAYWLCALPGNIEAHAIEPGLSMLTARDLNDPSSPRTGMYLPQFSAAEIPDPDTGDWTAWKGLLADKRYDPNSGPGGAMNVDHGGGFGTVSSSLIALPSPEKFETKPLWLIAKGRPGEVPYEPVDLGT